MSFPLALLIISLLIHGAYFLFLYHRVLFKETDANSFSGFHIFKLIKLYKEKKKMKYLIYFIGMHITILFVILSFIYFDYNHSWVN